MKGIRKRLLALTLCILMLGMQMITVFAAPVENCPGGCTHLAAIGATHYGTLEEAILAAEEGNTVTLLADIADQQPLNIEKSITLDLGGKTLTGQNSDAEGLLNVSADFTVQNGTVTTNAGTCLLVVGANLIIDKTAAFLATEDAAALILQGNSAIVIQEGETTQEEEPQWIRAQISGKLENVGGYPAVGIVSNGNVLCDVTIDEPASITSAEANAIEMYGSGKLTVNGGTFQAKEHIFVLDIPKDGAIEPAVSGGTFTCEKETFSITTAEGATAPAGFVTGGTYSQNPAAYIPDFCGVITNKDGTYTVVTAYTVKFKANGGSGTMKSVTVDCSKSVKLPKCGFTAPKGKVFAGWKIGSKTYAAGKTYTPKGNVTVTAQWKAKAQSGDKKPSSNSNSSNSNSNNNTSTKPHAHKLKQVAGYDPTCTKTGMNQHDKCTTCGKLFVDGVAVSARALTIPALGHTWETVEGHPATCLEDGLKEHQKCVDCGKLQVSGKTVKKASLKIPAGNHTLETVLAVAATCKDTGIQAHERCTVCEQTFVNAQPVEIDTLTIPTISHVLSDWYSDETEHWKSCTACGEVFRQKAHTDSDLDGICNDCGYTMTASQQEGQAPEETESGFNWLFLIPIVAAVAVAVPLGLKKRK